MAARELRTGHDASGNPVMADGSSDTAGKQAFVNYICSNMSWLQNQCAANLTIDVQTLTSYSRSPQHKSCFYSGSAGSAVELRTYYNWQMYTQALMSSLQSASTPGTSQIRSTEVFQVEPNGQTNPASTQC